MNTNDTVTTPAGTASDWLELISLYDSLIRQEFGRDTRMTWADIATHYGDTLPDAAVRFPTVAAVRRAVKASGSHYFDPAAIEWFDAGTHKVPGTGTAGLLSGRFWIESRRFHPIDDEAWNREYQIAWVSPAAAGVLSVERLGVFPSLEMASTYAHLLAAAVEKVAP